MTDANFNNQLVFNDIDLGFEFENLNINVELISSRTFSNGLYYDNHLHSSYEFHYVVNGNGNVNISGTDYELNAGDFYLTGPGVVHAQYPDHYDPMVEYCIKCNISLDKKGKDTLFENESKEIYDTLHEHKGIVLKDSNNMQYLFERAFSEINSKKPWYITEFKNSIFQIIIASARNITSKSQSDNEFPIKSLNVSRMDFVRTYIRDNLAGSLKIDDIARHLFMSSRQLNRIVSEETGCSVHEYIIQQKIEVARKLLRRSDLKIKDIAYMTGFSSEAHFSSSIKKYTGDCAKNLRNDG